MKKTLLIALAGLMMFAFTQCGDDNNGSKKEGEETIKGTKEYVTWKKAYEEAIKVVNGIEDCMDVYKAEDKFKEIFKEADYGDVHHDEVYEEKDRMTDKEREELLELEKELEKLIEKKSAGC